MARKFLGAFHLDVEQRCAERARACAPLCPLGAAGNIREKTNIEQQKAGGNRNPSAHAGVPPVHRGFTTTNANVGATFEPKTRYRVE